VAISSYKPGPVTLSSPLRLAAVVWHHDDVAAQAARRRSRLLGRRPRRRAGIRATTFAGTLRAGSVAGQPLDVFVAGDDEEAKATVSRLVRDAGMRAIDVGPLSRARQLEGLGYLHMAIQPALGTRFCSAVKVLP
jgi:hypothetical protein